MSDHEIDYEKLGREIGQLVKEKQQAYGNSFNKAGEFMQLLYPDGIAPDQYNDALAIVRIFDKLMRIATRKDAFAESPFRDISGYGLLGEARHIEDRARAALAAAEDSAKRGMP